MTRDPQDGSGLLELIELIYAAAEDPARWSDFAEALGRAVPALESYSAGCHVAAFAEGSVGRPAASASLIPARDLLEAAGAQDLSPTDRALIASLLPHVDRALQLCAHIAEAIEYRDAAAEAVDRLPVGVMTLDGERRVTFMNAEAATILRDDDGLAVMDGRPVAANPERTAALRETIDLVVRAGESDGPPAQDILLLPRSGRRAPLEARVIPVRPVRPFFGGRDEVAAVLLVRDSDRAPSLDVEALRALFDLTPSEARFASGLAEGLTTKELSERFGLARSTSRWMLEQVREKTGSRTQAQAVVRLLTSLATLRRGDRPDADE